MTKEQLASSLNGRPMGEETTPDEERFAKMDRLVIVFGYSDDNVELRGAINDEIGAYDGTTFYIHRGRVLPHHDKEDCNCDFCGYEELKNNAKQITALWGRHGYSWTYSTDIPHACFDVLEDGEKFCRGIVFSLDDCR